MAMIPCPNCSLRISDKATECPHCEALLENGQLKAPEIPPLLLCTECGMTSPIGTEICSTCGAPLPKEPPKPQDPKKRRQRLLIGAAIAIVLVLVGSFFIKQAHDKQVAKEDYIANLKTFNRSVTFGAVAAEDMANLNKKVWSNAIYYDDDINKWDADTKAYYADDFNVALNKLHSSQKWIEKLGALEGFSDKVGSVHPKLKKIPDDEFQQAHDRMEDVYDLFLRFTEAARNPTGSLSTYAPEVNDLDQDLSVAIKKFEEVLPEEAKGL